MINKKHVVTVTALAILLLGPSGKAPWNIAGTNPSPVHSVEGLPTTECPEPCVCAFRVESGTSIDNGTACLQLESLGVFGSKSGCCPAPGCATADCEVTVPDKRVRLRNPPPNGCSCTTLRVEGITVAGEYFVQDGLGAGTWSEWMGGGTATGACNDDVSDAFAYTVWQAWCVSSSPVELMYEVSTYYHCDMCDISESR